MKKTGVILTSIIGGAILGSTITMFLCPKSGEQMRKDTHDTIMEHINMLQEHIKKCKCMMGDCSTEATNEGDKEMSM